MLPAALSHRSFSTFTLLFSATSGHKMQQLSVWVWDRCWSSFWVVFGRKKGHVNYEVYPCHSASHSLIILLSAQAEQKMLCLILSTLFGTKKRWKRMESVLSCFMGITLTSADLWIRRWPMSDHNQMGSQRSLQLSICVFFFSDEMPHKAVRRRDAAIVITTPFPLKVNSAIKENTFGTQNCTKRSQSIRNSKLGFFFFVFLRLQVNLVGDYPHRTQSFIRSRSRTELLWPFPMSQLARKPLEIGRARGANYD